MARAAAKRKPAPRHDDAYRKKHKDSSGQRYEDTLFFNRLRTHAKWVFVLLIVVFGLGFVLFGVGSSVGGSGLSDIFNGIRGAGGNPSIDKPLKRTETNPKDAQAWKDLATAYDVRQEWSSAIPAWQTYVGLRPKDPAGLQSLATAVGQEIHSSNGEMDMVVIDLSGGYFYMMSAGANAYLAVLADVRCEAGRMSGMMRDLVVRIGAHLTSPPRRNGQNV